MGIGLLGKPENLNCVFHSESAPCKSCDAQNRGCHASTEIVRNLTTGRRSVKDGATRQGYTAAAGRDASSRPLLRPTPNQIVMSNIIPAAPVIASGQPTQAAATASGQANR